MTRLPADRRGTLFVVAAAIAAVAIAAAAVHITRSGHAASSSGAGHVALADARSDVDPVPSSPPGDPGTISAAEAARLHLSDLHRRGRFTDTSGRPFGVYVGTRSDRGRHCVVLAGAGGTAGSCDPRLFDNGPVAFVEAYSGGPAKARRTDFEIAGVVADSVARLDVVDSLGRVTRLDTSDPSKAFFFELEPADLARGVGVSKLVARDATGAILASLDVSEP